MGSQDLPTVNAILNGTSAILVVAGYVAIRGKRVGLHKVCMLTALVVSALFLASYLWYHIIVKHGESTSFTGPSAARAIYLPILVTHIVLAGPATVLALVTAYLGIRGRLRTHVRLARWTLPIWLYVSVTGVIVYLMLYHLYPAGDQGL